MRPLYAESLTRQDIVKCFNHLVLQVAPLPHQHPRTRRGLDYADPQERAAVKRRLSGCEAQYATLHVVEALDRSLARS
jgi:hypothetical protein